MSPQPWLLAIAIILSAFERAAAAVSTEAGSPANTRYHLTFDDEFNAYHASRWSTADFWGMRNNPGDFQGQWFCDPLYSPKPDEKAAYNPFEVREGTLRIIAQPTPKGVFSGPDNQPYVSGQLTSAHRFTQRYGYFELRTRLPAGKGLWSRFWLLTDDGVWPGEYDIFEIMGKESGIVHQTTHFRDLQRQHAAYGEAYKGINPTDGNFHIYGFLWEKTGVTWFVDGVPTLRQVNRIDIPMYVLIDLVVGKDPGNLWPGDPDRTNTWPAVMELDYYRVYSNDPALPSVTPDEGYAPSVLPYGLQVETTSAIAPLPPGWTAGDLVKLDVSGSTSWNKDSGEWLVKGSGYGNQGQLASIAHTGDGVVAATVASATIINGNDLKAGVTFRDGSKANSADVTLAYKVSYDSPKVSHKVVLQSGAKELAAIDNTDPPVSLRLMRSGNSFSGCYSPDGGRTWIPVGDPQVVVMPETLQAGLITGGNQSNYQRLSRAYFRDVSVSP